MLVQHHGGRPSITKALGHCMVLSGFPGAGIESVTRIMQESENMVQSPNAVSITVNIETALGECHVFAQSIQQTQ